MQNMTDEQRVEVDDSFTDGSLRQVSTSHHGAAQMSTTREILFIFTVCTTQLMTQAGLGQVLSSHLIIGQSFGTKSMGTLAWFIAAYSLTIGTFILIAGRLGDLFGYKNMFVIGFCWMGIWSLIAGLSNSSSYILFLFSRALQGIGIAILLPNSLALLGSTYAPGSKKKNMCFALFGATAPTGALLGIVFGAFFAQNGVWPWMFYCTSLASIFFAILGVCVIPNPPPHEPSGSRRTFGALVQEIDLFGGVTGISGLVCINIAWNQAPSVGWSTQYVYLLLIIGLILMALFVLIETRIAKYPLIPFQALTSEVCFPLAAVACGWANFGIWVYYFWQFLFRLRDLTPLQAAAQFAPVSPFGLIAAIMTGVLMHNIKPGWILLLSLLAFLTGTILIGTAPVDQTYWKQTFVSLCIAPFGMDMSFPAATVIMSNAVAKEHQGIAASLVTTVVNYSISIGLGIAATVEVNINHGGLTPQDLLRGYRGAWGVGMALAGLGILICVFFICFTFFRQRREKEQQEENQRLTMVIEKTSKHLEMLEQIQSQSQTDSPASSSQQPSSHSRWNSSITATSSPLPPRTSSLIYTNPPIQLNTMLMHGGNGSLSSIKDFVEDPDKHLPNHQGQDQGQNRSRSRGRSRSQSQGRGHAHTESSSDTSTRTDHSRGSSHSTFVAEPMALPPVPAGDEWRNSAVQDLKKNWARSSLRSNVTAVR